MTDRKRLLYVVYEPGDEKLGYRMARYGRDTGTFDVILWTPYGLPRNAEYKAEAAECGAVFLYENNPDGSLSAFQSDLSSWLSPPPLRLRQATPRSTPDSAKAALHDLSSQNKNIADAALQRADAILRRTAVLEDWMVRLGVDGLVLPEENVGRDSASWIEAARLRGIAVTIVTTWIVNPDFAEIAYRSDPNFQPDPAILPTLRQHLGHWLRERSDYALTRLPVSDALGLELTGLAPPDPWCVNTHPDPRVAVESAATIDDYARCGIDTAHLVATGAPSLDELALDETGRNALRRDLAAQAEADPDRPLCLLNPPPDRHANKHAPEFANYESLLDVFVRKAAQSWDGILIVSPHPATTDAQREIIRAAGGTVVCRPAVEIMPVADLYASAISSTIQMALAAALPVVCYEVYRYDTPPTFMQALPIKADTLEEFGTHIASFTDSHIRQNAREAAKIGAEHWGRLDGRNFDRVMALIFETRTSDRSSPKMSSRKPGRLGGLFKRSSETG